MNNYFSKHVSKLQMGGVAPETTQETPITEEEMQNYTPYIEEFIANPETYINAAASQNEELASIFNQVYTLYTQASAGDQQSAAQLQQVFSSRQILDAIASVVSSVKTSSMKLGGKVAYLNCLKHGGKPDCGCTKVAKAEEGRRIPALLKGVKNTIISLFPSKNKFTEEQIEDYVEPGTRLGYFDSNYNMFPDKYQAKKHDGRYGVLYPNNEVHWWLEGGDDYLNGPTIEKVQKKNGKWIPVEN